MAMPTTGVTRVEYDVDTLKEIQANRDNGCIGTTLVSETDEVRVWHLTVRAGERCAFHRHVLDYFWTCHSNGSARNMLADGTVREDRYAVGDTRHMEFARGQSMLHALENTGTTDLLFTVVEFVKGSANPPLPVPDSVRRRVPTAA
jgi:hypothetical protein